MNEIKPEPAPEKSLQYFAFLVKLPGVMLDLLEKPEARQLLYRVSREEYHRLTDGQATELIQGVIFQKMSKSPLHANFLRMLWKLLHERLPAGLEVISESPLALRDSEPEPDLAVVDPLVSLNDPHPSTAHLVIEISVTTQTLDEAKADLYAGANIPLYWQILLDQKLTVVYSQPGECSYKSVERKPFADELTATLKGAVISLRLPG